MPTDSRFIEFESHELNDNYLNEVVGDNLFEDYVVKIKIGSNSVETNTLRFTVTMNKQIFRKFYNDNLDEEIVDDLTTKLLNYRI